MTHGQIFNMQKEQIKHALDGELLYSENEDGPIYRPASKEECREFILRAYDNVVYRCLDVLAFGRVYDYILEKYGVKYTMQDILISKAIEDCRFQDYQYEPFEGEEE